MLQPSGVCAPGIIKTYPHDFVGREVHCHPDTGKSLVLGSVPQNDLQPRSSSKQQFTLFKVTKTGVSAQAAYAILARELEVERWCITDCGQKDAQAVTTQYIVVEGGYVPRCRDERIKVEYIGPTTGPLRRGGHQANFFSILVRTGVSTVPVTDGLFVNYFGPQRFGQRTATVGRLLLEGQIDLALQGLAGTLNGDKLNQIAARYDSSLEAALFDPAFEHERNFMVMQWRSYLWNKLVSERLQQGCLPIDAILPLWTPNVADEYAHMWMSNTAKILPHLHDSVSYGKRQAWAKAYHHKVTDHEAGWRHEFILKPGCYATVFLASLYDVQDASQRADVAL